MNDLDRESFAVIKRTVEKRGIFRGKIVSDSMSPLIRTGDLITIEPVKDPSKLERFEIVVFHQMGKLTGHFVWNHNRLGSEPTLTTKPLKSPQAEDLPVDYPSILGRITSHRLSPLQRLKVLWMNFRGRGF